MSRKLARQRPQPPMRDGISASCVVLPASAAHMGDIAQALAARLPGLSAQAWRERLDQGLVLDQALQPVSAQAIPHPQMALWYYRQLEHSEALVPFEQTIVFEDDRLVVVDKPHFLPVSPKGRYLQQTALVRLKRALNLPELVPMHRLDRETAGLLLFTKRPEDRHVYQALFAQRQVHKVYWAVVSLGQERWQSLEDHQTLLPEVYQSRLQERDGDAFMQMTEVPGEPNALTQIRVLRAWLDPTRGPLAHLELTPQTGRKHQLRAHCSALGCPIVGDRIYPDLWPHPPADAPPDFSNPLQLLAREVRFTDPIDGQLRRFVSSKTLDLVSAALNEQGRG